MNYCFEENRWGERFIPELNRSGSEQHSAEQHYAASLAFDPTADNQLTIIIGSDSGLLFRYLRGTDVPEGSQIVLIEPADVIETIREELSDCHVGEHQKDGPQRVSLLAADQWQSALFDSSDFPWFLAGNIELIQSDCAIRDFPNCYYPLYRETHEALSNRRHAVITSCAHRTFIREQMLNCVDLRVPLLRDPEFGRGRTALVMGGGSSLDEHLDWIIENRSKLFIIAVSRLCKKLDQMNFRPDLVMSMDPFPITYALAKPGTQWSDVPLVHSYHVAHQLLQQWLGPTYHVGARFPWDIQQAENTDTIENAGPTVGHGAIVVAARLGFTRILLSGIDLCMNAHGSSHAQGTPESELLKLPGNYDAQVTTYAGNQAGTSIDFFRSIDSLNHIGHEINQNETILFNLNANAAAIPSIPYIACNELELKADRPRFDSSDYRQPDRCEYEQLRLELVNCRKELQGIRTLCDKASHCLDQIYGRNGKPANPAYHKRLDTLESRLEKTSPRLLRAIRYLMSIEFAAIRKPSGFAAMNEQEMEQWARKYYEITDEGARFYQKAIKRAQVTLAIRKEELSPSADIAQLLESWQDQGTPGRVMKFLDTLLETADTPQRQALERARATFIESLKDGTSLDRRVRTSKGSIRNIMQSLRYLRNKGCESDLLNYSLKLEALEWPYDAISAFIRGSVADMRSEHEPAIHYYQQVIDASAARLNSGEESMDTVGSLVEDALSYLTRIYLEQNLGEEAANTLSVLSEISPQYIPSYANILDILGNSEAAVELLMLFLRHYPNNWRAARQLAQIHEKAGNLEARDQAEQQAAEIRSGIFRNRRAA